jgi:hypothetical protein
LDEIGADVHVEAWSQEKLKNERCRLSFSRIKPILNKVCEFIDSLGCEKVKSYNMVKREYGMWYDYENPGWVKVWVHGPDWKSKQGDEDYDVQRLDQLICSRSDVWAMVLGYVSCCYGYYFNVCFRDCHDAIEVKGISHRIHLLDMSPYDGPLDVPKGPVSGAMWADDTMPMGEMALCTEIVSPPPIISDRSERVSETRMCQLRRLRDECFEGLDEHARDYEQQLEVRMLLFLLRLSLN